MGPSLRSRTVFPAPPALVCAVKVTREVPAKYREFAERDAQAQMGTELTKYLMSLPQGQGVAVGLEGRWIRQASDGTMPPWFDHDEYRVTARFRTVIIERHDVAYYMHEASASEPKAPREMTTREIFKALWKNYKRWAESQETCWYTKPQSAYPDPEIFFNWDR